MNRWSTLRGCRRVIEWEWGLLVVTPGRNLRRVSFIIRLDCLSLIPENSLGNSVAWWACNHIQGIPNRNFLMLFGRYRKDPSSAGKSREIAIAWNQYISHTGYYWPTQTLPEYNIQYQANKPCFLTSNHFYFLVFGELLNLWKSYAL